MTTHPETLPARPLLQRVRDRLRWPTRHEVEIVLDVLVPILVAFIVK